MNSPYGKAVYLPKNTVVRVNFFVFSAPLSLIFLKFPKIIPIGGAVMLCRLKEDDNRRFGKGCDRCILGDLRCESDFNKYSQDWPNEQINTENKKYLVAFHVAPPLGKGELYIKAQVVTMKRGRSQRDIIADYKITPGDLVGKTPAILSLNPDMYKVECYWPEGGLKGSKTVPVKDREMAVAQFSWTIFYPSHKLSSIRQLHTSLGLRACARILCERGVRKREIKI